MQFTGSPKAYRYLLATLLIAVLAAPRAVHASDAFYLLYRQWQPYDWPDDEPSGDEVTRLQRGLGWRRQLAAGDFGLDYDYQPLRIRTGEPAHNGHLHRVTLGGQWQHGLYRVEARTGVAGTSNIFIDQVFHRDVVNGRVAVLRAWNAGSSLSLGVGGDHRFGSFRWLPRVRWEHTNAKGHWQMDLPVLLRWQGPDERWALRLERTGDRWATLDKTQDVENALYLREWRAELTYRVSSGRERWAAVVLGVGASVDTRVRYQDLEAGTLDLRLGNAFFGSIKLQF